MWCQEEGYISHMLFYMCSQSLLCLWAISFRETSFKIIWIASTEWAVVEQKGAYPSTGFLHSSQHSLRNLVLAPHVLFEILLVQYFVRAVRQVNVILHGEMASHVDKQTLKRRRHIKRGLTSWKSAKVGLKIMQDMLAVKPPVSRYLLVLR
jgi:hypothetical protein